MLICLPSLALEGAVCGSLAEGPAQLAIHGEATCARIIWRLTGEQDRRPGIILATYAPVCISLSSGFDRWVAEVVLRRQPNAAGDPAPLDIPE